ncbi:hypothetical protein SBV1_3300001 [Verrucomicrobia bacterium]|nr:hypothetical protein SBV1_3300001 [Verrucomicrobiota bacterium]
MTESQALLADFVKTRSELAFRGLVTRYLSLVYTTALRVVGGDAHLAEDVAQMVFVHLAQKAHRLSPDVMLGGWLHRTAWHVATTMMRGQRRRQSRERQAAEMNALEDHTEANLARLAPLLDDAIEHLKPEDRSAIMLRFFEQREFGSVGATLGITEDGARKRVERALNKLGVSLKRHGVALSGTALAAALAAETTTAAPAGLAVSITTSALAQAAVGEASLGFIKLTIMGKLKLAAIGAALTACLATPLVLQQRAHARLADENQILRQRVEQLAGVEAKNERLSNLLAQAISPREPQPEPPNELLRLRGEVGRLKEAERELETVQQKYSALLSQPNSVAPPQPEEASGPPKFFFVAGEVVTPGRFLWTNRMTLAAALQLAHGFTEAADPSVLQVKAPDGSSVVVNYIAPSNLSDLDFPIEAGVQVRVPRHEDIERFGKK